MRAIVYLLITFFLVTHVDAQVKNESSPILFIYDASGSMWGQINGVTKKEIAAEVLSNTVNNLPINQNIGLIAYGHRKKGDCDDIELLTSLDNNSKTDVISAVKDINPLGKTPLARSAILAINKLKETKTSATIILITDGIESCDGKLCDIVEQAKAEGIDFKLHIVGFGIKENETQELKCAAKAGNGNYYNASDANSLSNVLTEATTERIEDVPKNVSVFTIKNNKPIDGWVKAYLKNSQEVIDGCRTYGDTAYLSLPKGKYELFVQPLENSKVKPINISDFETFDDKIVHKTISFDGGKINLTTTNNGVGWDCTSKVLDKNGKTVGGARTYGESKTIEVNPGIYTVEIRALALNGLETTHEFKSVEVLSGNTTNLTHDFKSGKALIGVTSGDELIDATINIFDKTTKQNIAGGRSYTSSSSNPKAFTVNPGIYEVQIKALGKHAGKHENFTIEIKEAETTSKTINF